MNNKDHRFTLRWAKKIRAINLLGGKCVKCKNNDIYTLEFHHIDKDKDFMIGREGKEFIWEIIEKEADKCLLLCSNCHAEKHFSNGRGSKYKIELLKQLKIDKCHKCGYSGTNFNSLCFHHISSNDKKFNISNYFARKEGVSVERLLEEIKKCEVICKNCHKVMHVDTDKIKRFYKLIEYKIENHKSQPRIEEDIVKKLKADGKNITQISKILGRNKSSIFYVFHRV